MSRALELASLGIGSVSPNPMVGCVIVLNGKVIGEGWHKNFGGPHAEVNAINNVSNPDDLKLSTLYVNFEPCAHFGKTPPCADLIIEKKFKKVVVSNLDPNPEVNGKGFDKIRNHRIEVESGIMENSGKELNRRFFCFHEKKRPYIILKWAQTADGFIARKNYESKWISNDLARQLVHQWRSEEDAVMVGTNTAVYDNPQLTVRDWEGKNPLRIFIDNKLRVPESHFLIADEPATLCYNSQKNEKKGTLEYIRVNEENSLVQIMNDLYSRGNLSLMVEGGATLLNSFIESNLWDEARIFKSPTEFGKGITAPELNNEATERIIIDKDELRILLN